MAEDFVNCIGSLTTDPQQITFLYLQTLQEYYPEILDYLNCISNLFSYLQIKYANQLVESKFITQLLERQFESDDSDLISERESDDDLNNMGAQLKTQKENAIQQ